MNKIRSILGKIELHFLLFFIATILFVWPFFTVPNLSDNSFVFYFLYGSWFVIILIHILMDIFKSDEGTEN